LLYDYTNLDSFKINPFLAEFYSEDIEAKKTEKKKKEKRKNLKCFIKRNILSVAK
jgi:hypothetical protein